MNYDDWKTESPEDEHCRLYHRRRMFVERCKHGRPVGNGCCIEDCEECEAERQMDEESDEAENRFDVAEPQQESEEQGE